MAVLPINSVSIDANQYTFTGRKDKKDSHKANPLAGLPVVVMLAMAPIAEGKQPAQFVPIDSEHLTELVAQVNATAPKTYAASQESEIAKIQNLKYFRNRDIAHIQKVKDGNTTKGYLVMSGYLKTMDTPKNTVREIYYIDDVYLRNTPDEDPPQVRKLIYHDLGPGKEFCSIVTNQLITNKNTKEQKLITRGVKLDDESAQLIIDLLANDRKEFKSANLENDLKFYTTKDAKPQGVIVY